MTGDLPSAVRHLVAELYNVNEFAIERGGVQDSIHLYILAYKYQVYSIVSAMSKFLAEEVTPRTFPLVFTCGLGRSDCLLLHRCSQMLETRSHQVLTSIELKVLSPTHLHRLLRHPQLYVSSELQIFKAILAWGVGRLGAEDENSIGSPLQHTHHQASSLKLQASHCNSSISSSRGGPSLVPSGQTTNGQPVRGGRQATHQQTEWVYNYDPVLRRTVEEFLPYVKFQSLSVHDLVLHVFSSGVLTGGECGGVLQAREGIQTADLPIFLNVYQERRQPTMKYTVFVAPSNILDINLSYYYHEQISLNVLQNLRVSRCVSVVRISSTCITSLVEGSVKVWDSENKLVIIGIWSGCHCYFSNTMSSALQLNPEKNYTVTVTCREAWCATLQRPFTAVGNVTFGGETQCQGKVEIEYLIKHD
ncbi:hypothetical protein Pmani_023942 [Petrolisthes manimaculis]|uniref:BACK domain-containing protein n=1 Tax=Petrolisthes manimaculis TaxID=1843537 RepID=A0AAE1P8J6_9EUCA|nr:hypothetical protein Pmani_023942 [Petrolisthes manimaculis]